MRSATLVRGLRAVAPYLPNGYRWWFGGLAVIGLVIGVLEAFVLTIVGQLAASLDDGSTTYDVPVLGSVGWGSLVLAGVVALVVAVLLRVVESHLITRLGVEPLTKLRARLLGGYLEASFTQQQSERAGALQEMLMSHAPCAGFTAYAIATAIAAASILVVLAVAAALVDLVAFAVVVAIVLVLIVVTLPVERLARRFAIRQSEASVDYAVTAAETIASSTEIRLFASEDVAAGRVNDESDHVSHLLYRTKLIQSLTPNIYRSLVLGVVLVALGLLAASGLDDVAAASTVALLTIRALMETQRIHGATLSAAEYLSYVDRLHLWLDRYDDTVVVDGDQALTPVQSVDVAALGHEYPDASRPTLDGLDMTISPGERIGIVGPSGAGKTTLLAVVLGLLEPTDGRVLVNGRPPADYAPESWARQVAAVPQTPMILTTSTRENIRFFRDWVSDEDIHAAAAAAGIHAEIESWSAGYDTVIGDRGARALSGGQRQRVCIARALAGRPSLLLMDEPTSALDRAAEEVVSNTIDALGDDCAVVVVSHRATALRSCERLLRLDDGHLVPVSTAELVLDTDT